MQKPRHGPLLQMASSSSSLFPSFLQRCSRIYPEPPAGQLRLASPAATNFTAEMLAAVARMFPSTLMSTGGDELNTNCYAQDAETQADLKAAGQTLEEALDVFTQKTHAAIEAVGKTPAVWEGT